MHMYVFLFAYKGFWCSILYESAQYSPYGKAVSLPISGEYAANNWRTALFAVIVRNIFTSYREYPANKTGQSKKWSRNVSSFVR